jgi:hypothetical protein
MQFAVDVTQMGFQRVPGDGLGIGYFLVAPVLEKEQDDARLLFCERKRIEL